MFKREFKYNSISLYIWSAIIAFFFIIVMAIYPLIMTGGAYDINELMKAFPQEMLEMFNMDIFQIDTALGWIQSEGYIFWLLLGGVYVSMMGSSILTKEENDKTIEFLIAKPVKRSQIVTSKILCGLLNIVIFNILICLICIIGLSIIGGLDLLAIILMGFSATLLHIMLYTITLAFSSLFNKTSKTRGLGLGITFGAYLLQMVGSMSDKISFLQKISLFEFASVRYLAVHNHPNFIYLAIGIIIIGISVYFTYYQYNRKDLI